MMTTIHAPLHTSSAGGGGDVAPNGFTAIPLALALAAAAVKTAGCNENSAPRHIASDGKTSVTIVK